MGVGGGGGIAHFKSKFIFNGAKKYIMYICLSVCVYMFLYVNFFFGLQMSPDTIIIQPRSSILTTLAVISIIISRFKSNTPNYTSITEHNIQRKVSRIYQLNHSCFLTPNSMHKLMVFQHCHSYKQVTM